MSIIIQRPWTRQPQLPVGIDKANHLARGLIFACIPGFPVNLATGVSLTTIGATFGPSPMGRRFDAGGYADVIPTAAGARGSEFDLQVMSAFIYAQQSSEENASRALFRGQGSATGLGWALGLHGGSADGAFLQFANTIFYPESAGNVLVPTTAAFTSDGATVTLYCNGQVQSTAAYATATYEYNTSGRRLYFGSIDQNEAQRTTKPSVGFIWNRAISSDEVRSVSRNPWQLFAPLPRRIWVPSAGTGVSVSTGVGALTISGLAPTVTQQIAVSTGVGALTITGQAPSASVSGGAAETTPAVGALTITTYAPTVTQQIAVEVNSGALVLSSSAPTVATGTQVSVGSAAMTLAGLAPTITQAIIVTPGSAALTLSAYAPSAELPDKTVSVDVAELIITGYGPTVDGGTVVQTATRGGGHHRRVKQRRYVVKIDDEEFIVASIAEAKKLISAAEEAAKEKAEQAVAKVVAAGKKTKRKAIQEAREELRPPVIEIEGAIDLAEEAEARIAEIYDSALAIARNVARRRDEDDDEDVLLLL